MKVLIKAKKKNEGLRTQKEILVNLVCWVWWLSSLIPELGRLKRIDHREFKTSIG